MEDFCKAFVEFEVAATFHGVSLIKLEELMVLQHDIDKDTNSNLPLSQSLVASTLTLNFKGLFLPCRSKVFSKINQIK